MKTVDDILNEAIADETDAADVRIRLSAAGYEIRDKAPFDDDEAIKRIAQAIAASRGFGAKATHCMIDATVAWAEAKAMIAAAPTKEARHSGE